MKKIINYLKLQYAKLTGKATHVEYLAMPLTDLRYEFLFRINGGKWEEGYVTVQEQFTHGKKAPVDIHFEKLTLKNYYWDTPPQIKGPAYYTVLRKRAKIMQAMDSITKQYEAGF